MIKGRQHQATSPSALQNQNREINKLLKSLDISTSEESPKKPYIYIAGKISKNCFRHSLVPDLREHSPGEGPIECPGFIYTGPFFVSCDHGCFHIPSSHGALPEKSTIARLKVADDCIRAIKDSDIVFSYITSKDCFGTIMEIGAAIALKKKIVICYAPKIQDIDDLWLTNIHASGIYQDIPQDALLDLLKAEIKKFNALEEGRK